MANKLSTLMPARDGDWLSFNVRISYHRKDKSFKLEINGEDSERGRTFRWRDNAKKTLNDLATIVARLQSDQLA